MKVGDWIVIRPIYQGADYGIRQIVRETSKRWYMADGVYPKHFPKGSYKILGSFPTEDAARMRLHEADYKFEEFIQKQKAVVKRENEHLSDLTRQKREFIGQPWEGPTL